MVHIDILLELWVVNLCCCFLGFVGGGGRSRFHWGGIILGFFRLKFIFSISEWVEIVPLFGWTITYSSYWGARGQSFWEWGEENQKENIWQKRAIERK